MLRCIQLLRHMYTSCPGQNQSEKRKNPQVTRLECTYVSIYENVIFLHYRNEDGQNYPK